jgi:protein-disulfide isomerase
MYEDAKAQGVGGTPTYQVENGKPTFGDLDISSLRQLILGSSPS